MQSVYIIVLSVVVAVIAVLVVQVLRLLLANRSTKASSSPFKLLQENSNFFELPEEIQGNYNYAMSSRAFEIINGKFPVNKKTATPYQPIESLQLDVTPDNDAVKLLIIVKQLAFLQETGLLTGEEFETLKVRIFERIYRNY